MAVRGGGCLMCLDPTTLRYVLWEGVVVGHDSSEWYRVGGGGGA